MKVHEEKQFLIIKKGKKLTYTLRSMGIGLGNIFKNILSKKKRAINFCDVFLYFP